MEFRCPYCKRIIIEDADEIDKIQYYLMCPYCGEIMKNPFYEGEE